MTLVKHAMPFNTENKIGADLTVLGMAGWRWAILFSE
jgi:uncharacterized protein YbbC (DUF1343 family)